MVSALRIGFQALIRRALVRARDRPVKVPKAASDIAQPGWSINIVLGRANETWHVVEVGNVYP
jgi:hypothetical protein